MSKRKEPELTPEQKERQRELTKAVTPNNYLDDSRLNPDTVRYLEEIGLEGKQEIIREVKQLLFHLEKRRNFIPIPREHSDDLSDLLEPRFDWAYHFIHAPDWNQFYWVDFNRPYHLTNQEQDSLEDPNTRYLIIGWKDGIAVLKVPIVVVRWDYNQSREPSIPSSWYYLDIQDEYSGEVSLIDLMFKSTG